MYNSLIGQGLCRSAGVGAGHHRTNENDSHPPPTKSRHVEKYTAHLVGPRKMGGGPGEGPKKKSGLTPRRRDGRLKRRAGVGEPACLLLVLRVLLSARHPRTAMAIAASADVARASAYRVLLRLELHSGLPILRQRIEKNADHPATTLWGIDWPRWRGMC